MLKRKVSWLRLMAIIWTASSDAARQACGKAEARWIGGNAQAVTDGQDVPCTLVAVPAAVLRPQNGQSLSTESAGNFLDSRSFPGHCTTGLQQT
jgi:hypothetical protein